MANIIDKRPMAAWKKLMKLRRYGSRFIKVIVKRSIRNTLPAAVSKSHNDIKEQLLRNIHHGVKPGTNDDKRSMIAYLRSEGDNNIYAVITKDHYIEPDIFMWQLNGADGSYFGEFTDLDELVEAIAKRWW